VANILAYLQHHLQEVTEQQNNLENNINNALYALTAQLQQLMQLVSNPQSPAPATLHFLVPIPPTSPLAATRS